MSNLKGGFTLTSTGNQSITGVGFQSNDIDFEAGPKSGSSTSSAQRMSGSVDSGGNNYVIFEGVDNVSSVSIKSEKTTSKCILIYERISGTWTKILEASFVSFDADGFTVNVTTAHANAVNYQILAKCRIV